MLYKIKKNEIEQVLNEAVENHKQQLENMVGDLESTRIEYPKPFSEEGEETEKGEPKEQKEKPILKMPEQLVQDTKNLVDILSNAKTVLTKLGNHTSGAESEELWSYHRKVEKIIIDIQRKFKITH